MKKIGIIGTGMIGTSLAVLSASHAIDTVVLAVNEELKNKSLNQFKKFLNELNEEKIINEENILGCLNHLEYTYEYESFKDCEYIFEAVVENIDIKHEVYNKIEEHVDNLKAICSVSSAIEVDKLSEKMNKYRDKILVTHPFFPPHVIPYFEIAYGKLTNTDIIYEVKKMLASMDRKVVILNKSVPGFIGNRLQFALYREALNLIQNNVCAVEDIDTCLKYSFCPRYTSIGMFEHFDNGGLILNLEVCKSIFPTLNNDEIPPKVLLDLVEQNELGRITGKGFYNWDKEFIEDFDNRVLQPYLKFINWEFPDK